MDLLELLAAGRVDEFNAERGSRRKLEFFAADLPGVSLIGADLEGVNLEKSDLTGATLDDASLMRANLAGIDGSEMSLRGALGPRVRLRDAWLEDADLTEADFTKGDLKEAYLVRTQGQGLVATGTRFVGADAREANWSGCYLTEASLSGADFSSADLSRSDLSDASANDAKFVGARLDAVLATRFKAAGADLSGASLVGSRLDGANLAGANLTNANLTGCDLRDANLTGANLTGATLQGAVLAGATLEEVDFTGLDLTGVDLTGVDPGLLGLSKEQIDSAAGVGASPHADAPRKYEDPVGGHANGLTAVLWVNTDGEEVEVPEDIEDMADAPKTPRSIRWSLLGDDGSVRTGVLALPAEGILGKAVIPSKEGFALWLVVKRPDGVMAFCYPLSSEGKVGRRQSHPLGYPPAVPPVIREEPHGLMIYGVAARGPTAITHRLTTEGLEPIGSTRMATATGMVGLHDPIVTSKGGVITPLGARRAENPLRAPEGFPGRRSTAARRGDETMLVWTQAPVPERDPGGVRWAWLVRRGNPEVEVLTEKPGVVSIDAVSHKEQILVAFVEIAFLEGETLKIAHLPDGFAMPVDLGDHAPEKVRFVQGTKHPLLLVTTPEGGVLVVDPLTGRLRAHDEDGGALEF
ncbi:MAG: pentapeptide repeat-containing protein [Deltaproteobacteria bacterium]|nr:MAG: pentapeptide repeat-containing protein [Deltaproteobacteria bacterium]